jgi:phosphoglycerate dehydrogenase-like enzyme
MKLSVHVLYSRYDEAALTHLRSRLHPDIRLSGGADLPGNAEYHILVAGRPRREHITASPNLQALVVPWAGLPESTRQLMLEFPHVAVHNLHHNAGPVAELAIALLLAAAKFLIPMDRALRRHDWTPRYRPNPSILLEGKTALILGYGAIGRRVAQSCRGLGMEVMAIRRGASAPAPGIPQEMPTSPEALRCLLPQAHVLIICLPHTPETTGLIGAEELALLPPNAVLVNVGRGPIVDEAALYFALRDRALHAAGLDVWYNYPPAETARSQTSPSAYPFHELDNVVMSPHRGGASTETETLRVTCLAELLNAAARGEPMPNPVDLRAGY